MALERCYGGGVWEGLLHNPQLSSREVARMVKSGSLPTTLLTLVAANRSWVADSAIVSALLGNPRLAGPQLDRLLRSMSQPELRKLSAQTQYRAQVRSAAKRLIRG